MWSSRRACSRSRPGRGTSQARTVGKGTARSCTSAAVVSAVRAGGTIRFSCGSRPVTIRMRATAKVLNTRSDVVLDGGGKVTLSGQGRRRILYMNTCDRSLVWATPHCQDQATPRLVVRNIAFAKGNSTGEKVDGGGGGAIFVRGGRLRIERATFTGNRCDPQGPDIGGGAVRVLSQFQGLPVEVADSRFTRQRLQQRRRAEQHRRVVERRRAAASAATARSAAARTPPGAARRAAAAAAPSTTTATAWR